MNEKSFKKIELNKRKKTLNSYYNHNFVIM